MARKKNTGNAIAVPPWQVKGIEYETREAVKLAARKAGLPIGTWVNQTLHRAATEEATGKGHQLPAKIEDQLGEVLKAIQEQGATLEEMKENRRRSFWQRLKN
jgi:hypothetical protein